MNIARIVHTISEIAPQHYVVFDGDGVQITTFDTLDPGEFTPEQYYCVVMASIFRRMVSTGPGPF